VLLAIAGTVALAVVLLFSLRPTQKPRVLPSADISKLAPGTWMSVDSDRLRFFVVRPLAGEPYALAAPIDNGEVLLPEVYWWKPHTRCKDFGLELRNGAVGADSLFRCRDANLPDEWSARWQWDTRGKHLPHPAGKIDNLYGVRTERDDDELVFVGLEPD
jgi:hypothetical protein